MNYENVSVVAKGVWLLPATLKACCHRQHSMSVLWGMPSTMPQDTPSEDLA